MAGLHKEFHPEIRQMIESGEYFKDAMDWYDTRYHSPVIEKAYFVVVTVLAMITTWLGVQAVIGLLPMTHEQPFIVQMQNVDSTVLSIHYLADNAEDVDFHLASYLVRDYVNRRERYMVNEFERDVIRVRAMSSREEFLKYRKQIHPSNPNSPRARFERYSSRDVSRMRVKFVFPAPDVWFDEMAPTKAVVDFTAQTQGRINTEPERYRATLDIDYKPLEVDQENYTVKPMELKVTNYRVERIQEKKPGS